MSALGAGFSVASVPSTTQAKDSAQKVFSIIDEQSSNDSREEKELTQVSKGSIEFKNVTFNYPTRKHKVLNEFNLLIPAGRKIGLVGHSGCGKSTIANLLLRFYDHQSG